MSSKRACSRIAVPAVTLALATRQLAVMLRAGIPLARALHLLARQAEDFRFGMVVLSLLGSLQQGRPFSEALGAFPRVFHPVFVALAREGESTGDLAGSLDRAARFLEEDVRLTRRLKAALLYPASVLGVGTGTGILCLRLLTPYLRELSGDAPVLPLATRALMLTTEAFTHGWVWVASVLAALAGVHALRRHVKTPEGRLQQDRWTLAVPVLGELVRRVILCRLARTLAASLRSGLRLPESLKLCAEVTGNELYRRDLHAAWEAIYRGDSLAQHLRGNLRLYTAMFAHFVAVGTEAGRLPAMTDRFADLMELSAEARLQLALDLLNPALLVVMGLCTGWVALATFPALYSALGQVQP
ncbi:MAG: type II secretion system F family protein [Candidatus Eremiobacterota bacterium]